MSDINLLPFSPKPTSPSINAKTHLPAPLIYAISDVYGAACDFAVEIQECQSIDQALLMRQVLNELSMVLSAMESAALQKADLLCGSPVGRES